MPSSGFSSRRHPSSRSSGFSSATASNSSLQTMHEMVSTTAKKPRSRPPDTILEYPHFGHRYSAALPMSPPICREHLLTSHPIIGVKLGLREPGIHHIAELLLHKSTSYPYRFGLRCEGLGLSSRGGSQGCLGVVAFLRLGLSAALASSSRPRSRFSWPHLHPVILNLWSVQSVDVQYRTSFEL